MNCKIDGCEKKVQYSGKQLCQMHYFRWMRYGTFDLTRKAAIKVRSHSEGYVLVHDPEHKLAGHNGYVYQHRHVMYEKYGDILPNCEICETKLDWSNGHIDHKDKDRKNNNVSNLRPLCVTCNTHRDMPEYHTFTRCMAITFDGKTDTPHGWSRDHRVKISSRQIKLRKISGMSDYDALFSPKKTHSKKDATKPEKLKTAKLKELKASNV